MAGSGSLPPHVEDMRTRVRVGQKAASYTADYSAAGAFAAMGVDTAFDAEGFRMGLKVEVVEKSADGLEMCFDVIGIEAPIANALRRILLAEVPTMAIEYVDIYNNTSIINDEVLAHRLGLIPINADPRRFEPAEIGETGFEPSAETTLTFKLQKICTRVAGVASSAPESEKYEGSAVYARDLEWLPIDDAQREAFADKPAAAVHGDILIAKLRPGQELDLELKCVKNVGKVHAKWSPVATASYRLMPDVRLVKPVEGGAVDKLMELMPNVFSVEKAKGAKGGRRAVVENPRACTFDRNVLEPSIAGEELAQSVELYRIKNHYIFSLESTGALSCEELVGEALDILAGKCATARDDIEKTLALKMQDT